MNTREHWRRESPRGHAQWASPVALLGNAVPDGDRVLGLTVCAFHELGSVAYTRITYIAKKTEDTHTTTTTHTALGENVIKTHSLFFSFKSC